MMRKQKGFTLIELVAVIVILGALAVVALPRFVNLQDEAQQAAAEGVAGALSAGFALNYADYLAEGDDFVQVNSDLTGDLSASPGSPWSDIMQDASVLEDYTVGSCDLSGSADGASVPCTLNRDDGSLDTAPTFTAIAASV